MEEVLGHLFWFTSRTLRIARLALEDVVFWDMLSGRRWEASSLYGRLYEKRGLKPWERLA